MKTSDAIKELELLDKQDRFVYSKRDLAKVFRSSANYTLVRTISRLERDGILKRVYYGVYVYALSKNKGEEILSHIALTIRRGNLVYESLESALSRWGVISQIMVDRITCMTSGRSLEAVTSYGVIEFIHTKKNFKTVADKVVYSNGDLIPLAMPELAVADLRRVGRNLDLIDWDALTEYNTLNLAEREGLV
jgi:predicted transcriptional regulator of viral defense system